MHAGVEPQEFVLPESALERKWRLFLDTAAESPRDIFPEFDGPPLAAETLTLAGRSMVCYVSDPTRRR
jgi:isoamylase